MVQDATGIDIWRNPFRTLRAPIFFDLAIDPDERARKAWATMTGGIAARSLSCRGKTPGQNTVGKTLMSFKEFPPRRKPAGFTIEQAMEALMNGSSGSK